MAGIYDGLEFRNLLVARWAAFFDLAGWTWQSNPVAVNGWKPDFRVSFTCGHSECSAKHTLLVSVLPIDDLQKALGHPAQHWSWRVTGDDGEWRADAGAVFGNDPKITSWEMSHGAGGGMFEVPFWVQDAQDLWRQAGNRIVAA